MLHMNYTYIYFPFAISQWEVADAVLEVFHKLLRDYEPQPSDFVQEMVELQGEQLPAHKPPGHSIMFHLLNDSPTLALCLSLLEEGVRQLDTYAPFPGERTYAAAVKRKRDSLLCVCVCSDDMHPSLFPHRQEALGVGGAALPGPAGLGSAEGGCVHGPPQGEPGLPAGFPLGAAPPRGQSSNSKG